LEIVYPGLSDYMSSSEDAWEDPAIDSGCLGVVLIPAIFISPRRSGERLEEVGDLLLQVHVNDNDSKQQQNAIP
jgi:hypothetical protein